MWQYFLSSIETLLLCARTSVVLSRLPTTLSFSLSLSLSIHIYIYIYIYIYLQYYIAKIDATHNILDPPCMHYAFGIAMTVL